VLKWAQTRDGFVDKNRANNELGINWITQPETKKLVHQWRAEEAAILVGKQTVLNDNPSLTVREYKGKNPVRIVLDSRLEIPENFNVFSKDAKTLIINTIKSKITGHLEWIQVDELPPKTVLELLYKKKIQSVIIEGGKRVLESFIQTNLWDEARVLIGIANFNNGLKAPQLPTLPKDEFKFAEDSVLVYWNS
jgi:diaminohydroxyphosphoribosylaminopyrimidine deaminase/5-amino-6-(5-phosphoribosylamino)uracil reductase